MKDFIFKDILEEWYAAEGRKDLPWRGITDPYRIWISEIILQQTRVVQGMEYYRRFIERFPDVRSLAEAEEDEVLKLWQGLGYYSRARNLHAAAKSIVRPTADKNTEETSDRTEGRTEGRSEGQTEGQTEDACFPETYEGVRALKGVGDYTAAAICSFAYRLPYPVVDGNVYRVLSRIYGIETPIDSTRGKQEFTELAGKLLDRERPDIYNSAIMDFGAIQCTPKAPDCMFCPFSEVCKARLEGKIEELPVKAKKTAVRERFFTYIYIEDGKDVLMHRRPEGDIWQGLYEPYLIETSSPATLEDICNNLSSELPIDISVLDKAPLKRDGTISDPWKRVPEPWNEVPEPTEEGVELTEEGTERKKEGTELIKVAEKMKHVLSHQVLWVDCYHLKVHQLPVIGTMDKESAASADRTGQNSSADRTGRNTSAYMKVPINSRDSLAVPKLVSTLFSKIDNRSAAAAV